MKILKSKYFLMVTLICIILLSQMVLLLIGENEVIVNYESNISSDIVALTDVSIKNKMNVTGMLYNMLITEEVKDIMLSVSEESYESKADLRDELYDIHSENYNFMTSVGVNQFQFHLPSTESFLRFHAPDKFGDALVDYRESVNQVIESNKLSNGYEEGRVFGGYRYVYPIMKKNKYVGSVEFSFDMDKIIKPVEETYGVYGVLIMDEDEVKEKAFSSVKKLYVEESYTKLGYIIPSESHGNIIDRLGVSETLFAEVSSDLGDEKRLVYEDEIVFLYAKSSDTLLWAISIPLIDVKNETVGQLVYYKNDKKLYDMMEKQRRVIINSMILMAISLSLISAIVMFFANLKNKVTYDSLTKLHTRHAFYETIVDKIEDGVVLMIDIDDFKDVNDKHGHFVGDEVLKNISEIINNNIRPTDYAIRWGGEEFLVLFMCSDMHTGIERAKTLVKLVASSEVSGVKSTISIGVSQLTKDYEKSFKLADDALYNAKSAGKNTVYVTEDEEA